MKIHSGSDKELLTALSLYGIQGDHLLPYVSGGYRSTRYMEAWIEDRYRLERQRQQQQHNTPIAHHGGTANDTSHIPRHNNTHGVMAANETSRITTNHL
jgi:hypothetical protein